MSLYQEFIDGKVQLNACRVSPYALESFTVLGDKKSLSHTEVAFARLVDGRGRGVPVAIKAGKNIAQVLQRWPAITTEYTIQEEIDAYMGLLYEVTMYEYISKYVLAPRLALNFIGFIGQGRCRGVIDPRSKTAGRAPVDQNPAYTRWIDLVDRKAFTQVANLQSVGAVYAKLDEDSQRQRQGLLKALAIEQKLQDAYQQAKEIAEREDRSAQEAARGLENVRDREGGDFLQDLRDEAKHEELVQQARQRNALARQALFRANRDFQDNQQLIAQLKAELEALVAPRREQVGESFVELNQLAEDVASAETNVLITYKPDNIEKLVDWWNSVATRNSEAADEVMAQIFYNLHVMERLEILHGDLHTGNVFVQTLARPVTLELGAGQVKLTVSTRYIVYFYDWDWGFKDVLGPNLRFRDPGYCSEFRNCNKFIRLYDMFILLSALDFPMEYARGIATPSTLSQVLRQVSGQDVLRVAQALDAQLDLFQPQGRDVLTPLIARDVLGRREQPRRTAQDGIAYLKPLGQAFMQPHGLLGKGCVALAFFELPEREVGQQQGQGGERQGHQHGQVLVCGSRCAGHGQGGLGQGACGAHRRARSSTRSCPSRLSPSRRHC